MCACPCVCILYTHIYKHIIYKNIYVTTLNIDGGAIKWEVGDLDSLKLAGMKIR